MALTLERLIERVEKRLQVSAGLDIQIHMEDTLVELAQHAYNVLFDDFWWNDYLTLETFTLDGVSGLITGDITGKINTYRDIHSVFYGDNPSPLPQMSIASNPLHINARAIGPYNADPTKVFRVYPANLTGEVSVWYRTKLTDAQWASADPQMLINMDDDLLVLGVAFDYLSSDGSNIDDAGKLKGMFDARLKQMRDATWEAGISKRSQEYDSGPDRWV